MKKYDICVFGGCSMDMTFYQNEDLSYNEIADISVAGGKGANQAVAASRAGAKVVMLTRVGDDEIGQKIIENLKNNGVETSFIDKDKYVKNDVCKIYIRKIDADNDIRREVGAITTYTPKLIEKYKEVILASKMVIMQLKAPIEFSKALINFCYENNIPVVLTPCHPERLCVQEDGNKEFLDKVSYITANKREAEIMFGTEDLKSCVELYPQKLLVTLGSNGVLYNNGRETKLLPTQKNLKVVDTTGAGDTFCGNFAAFMVGGMNFEKAIQKAQYASQIKIATKTAQKGMPYLKDLEDYIKQVEAAIQE
ncbi:MAG: ribokinase [Clostridia bacterium]|nr:ribokinase [Clostridia bacterium]